MQKKIGGVGGDWGEGVELRELGVQAEAHVRVPWQFHVQARIQHGAQVVSVEDQLPIIAIFVVPQFSHRQPDVAEVVRVFVRVLGRPIAAIRARRAQRNVPAETI